MPIITPVTRKAGLLNTTLKDYTDLSIVARIYNLEGKLLWEKRDESERQGEYGTGIIGYPRSGRIKGAYFLRLALNADVPNIYWLTTEPKDYTSLSQLPKSRPGIKTEIKREGSNFVGTVRSEALIRRSRSSTVSRSLIRRQANESYRYIIRITILR